MNLDFNQFPIMDNGYLATPAPSDALKMYMDVYNRFCSTIYFASSVNSENILYMISSAAQREAYLRAALSEFISIEDLLKLKFPNDKKRYSLLKSANPLFHFLKQLRNYNIHLCNSNIKTEDVAVIIKGDRSGKVHQIDSYYIDNLDITEFMKLDCFTKYQTYSKKQFEKMIEMFEREQRRFGVGDLLIRATLEYSFYIEKFLTKNSS